METLTVMSHAIEITQSGADGGKNHTIRLELNDDAKAAIETFTKLCWATRPTRRGYANLFAIIPAPRRPVVEAADCEYQMQVILARHSWEGE